jgi:hypothetical protein
MISSVFARLSAALSAFERATAAGVTIVVYGASVAITAANDSDEGLGFMTITDAR